MRLVDSLAVLSLASLSLAAPVASDVADTVSSLDAGDTVQTVSDTVRARSPQVDGVTDTVSSLTGGIGGLGLRSSSSSGKASSPARVVRDAIAVSDGGEFAFVGEGKGKGKGKGKGTGNGPAKGKGITTPGPPDVFATEGSKGSNGPKAPRDDGCADTTTPAPTCLLAEDITTLVDAYVRILSADHWDDANGQYLAEDFVDRSDSINSLAGIPLGTATFATKKAFIEYETKTPDNLPLVVTRSTPTSCTEIALIWQATFGMDEEKQQQVRGLTIIGATNVAGFWQIKSLDVEFNNIAYLENIGGSINPPAQ